MKDTTLASFPLMILSSFLVKEINAPSPTKLADAVGTDANNNSWQIREAMSNDGMAEGEGV